VSRVRAPKSLLTTSAWTASWSTRCSGCVSSNPGVDGVVTRQDKIFSAPGPTSACWPPRPTRGTVKLLQFSPNETRNGTRTPRQLHPARRDYLAAINGNRVRRRLRAGPGLLPLCSSTTAPRLCPARLPLPGSARHRRPDPSCWNSGTFAATGRLRLTETSRDGLLHPEDSRKSSQPRQSEFLKGTPHEFELGAEARWDISPWFFCSGLSPLKDERGDVTQWYGSR